jgi:hypothetical protein
MPVEAVYVELLNEILTMKGLNLPNDIMQTIQKLEKTPKDNFIDASRCISWENLN